MLDSSKVRFFDATNKGNIICIYGKSGSGKSWLADKIRDHNTIILDGDAFRYYISDDLGFSDKDREKNNIRIAKIAALLATQGHNVIVSTVRADIAARWLKEHGYELRLYHIE